MATTAIRYRVTAHEPGRRVEFTFDPAVAKLHDGRPRARQDHLMTITSGRFDLTRWDAEVYVGIERVTAAVDERTGTFVFRHSAVGSASGGSFGVDVVPDSGTGELLGLRGSLSIERSDDGEHTYTFDYELG